MYYFIEYKTGSKETGPEFPQASCLSQVVAHQIVFDKFAKPTAPLKFELQKRSKLTDILSQAAISAHGMLISDRVKILLEGVRMMPHRFYPATVKTAKEELHYHWLHLVDPSLIKNIDFAQSKFYRAEYGFREEDVDISSYDDFVKKDKAIGKMSVIESDFIKLHKFDVSLDLFVLPQFDSRIYASKKLFDLFTKEKITGIELKKASSIEVS